MVLNIMPTFLCLYIYIYEEVNYKPPHCLWPAWCMVHIYGTTGGLCPVVCCFTHVLVQSGVLLLLLSPVVIAPYDGAGYTTSTKHQ